MCHQIRSFGSHFGLQIDSKSNNNWSA